VILSAAEKIGEGLYRIPVPIPFPMKYMYACVAIGDDGVDVIDAGFHTDEAKQAWAEAFRELKIAPRDVRRIVLTHLHPDHFGLAGWMQEWTQAPVLMSRTDMERATRLWGGGTEQAEKMGEMAYANGAPRDLADEITQGMLNMKKRVLPLPELTPLEDEEVWLGGRPWRVFAAPGHSDGHLCFYEPGQKIFIAGDHLLDPITPNISKWPDASETPLADYLQSLRRTAELDIAVSYGGHGKPIPNVRQRVAQIMEHHERRLALMLNLAKAGRTAYETAAEVFRDKALTAHQWRFAIAETIAHLDYLTAEGKLAKEERGGITVYGETFAREEDLP